MRKSVIPFHSTPQHLELGVGDVLGVANEGDTLLICMQLFL